MPIVFFLQCKVITTWPGTKRPGLCGKTFTYSLRIKVLRTQVYVHKQTLRTQSLCTQTKFTYGTQRLPTEANVYAITFLALYLDFS